MHDLVSGAKKSMRCWFQVVRNEQHRSHTFQYMTFYIVYVIATVLDACMVIY